MKTRQNDSSPDQLGSQDQDDRTRHRPGRMKTFFLRHLLVGALSALMVYLFYLSYGSWGVEAALWPAWDQDHPLWRAFAHAAFVLLFLSLALGPASRLWGPVASLLSWRRECGIWFVVLSIGHGYVIWDRWARWDVATLFGFQYAPEVGSYILTRPEVGIMNLMGLVVLPMIVLLALTSSDWATELLGPSWKWLHASLVHAIFYVLMLRGILYFFFFFQFSPPNWRFYPPIWFLYVFLAMGIMVVVLQAAAFAKTALQRLDRAGRRSVARALAIIGMAALFVLPMALATGMVAYFDARVLKQPPGSSVNPADPLQTRHLAPLLGSEIDDHGRAPLAAAMPAAEASDVSAAPPPRPRPAPPSGQRRA